MRDQPPFYLNETTRSPVVDWTVQASFNHIRAKQLNTGRGKVGYNESQHNLPFRVRLGLKSLKGIFRAGNGKLFGKGQDSKYFSLAA